MFHFKTETSAHPPNKGPFSETSSAGSGSGSRSMPSEYESDWPPLTVGASSPTGGDAAHSGPAAEARVGSPLLKLLESRVPCTKSACCCCFCKAAWDKRKDNVKTLNNKPGTQTKNERFLEHNSYNYYPDEFVQCCAHHNAA